MVTGLVPTSDGIPPFFSSRKPPSRARLPPSCTVRGWDRFARFADPSFRHPDRSKSRSAFQRGSRRCSAGNPRTLLSSVFLYEFISRARDPASGIQRFRVSTRSVAKQFRCGSQFDAASFALPSRPHVSEHSHIRAIFSRREVSGFRGRRRSRCSKRRAEMNARALVNANGTDCRRYRGCFVSINGDTFL